MSVPTRALAIDTATDVLAIAAVNGDARVALTLRRGLQHSPTLVPLVERLLAEISLPVREIQRIVCSVGPGSFTGIRIGLATAKGIGFAAGIPLVGVSTLDALACPFGWREGDTFAVLDARKGNIYAAWYRGGARISEYLDLPPRELRAALEAADRPLLVGPDAERLRGMAFPDAAGQEPACPPARPFSIPAPCSTSAWPCRCPTRRIPRGPTRCTCAGARPRSRRENENERHRQQRSRAGRGGSRGRRGGPRVARRRGRRDPRLARVRRVGIARRAGAGCPASCWTGG